MYKKLIEYIPSHYTEEEKIEIAKLLIDLAKIYLSTNNDENIN